MNLRNPAKLASVDIHTVGLTEQIIDENSRYLVLINYEPFEQKVNITVENSEYKAQWINSVDGNVEILSVNDGIIEINLPANTGAVIMIKK